MSQSKDLGELNRTKKKKQPRRIIRGVSGRGWRQRSKEREGWRKAIMKKHREFLEKWKSRKYLYYRWDVNFPNILQQILLLCIQVIFNVKVLSPQPGIKNSTLHFFICPSTLKTVSSQKRSIIIMQQNP